MLPTRKEPDGYSTRPPEEDRGGSQGDAQGSTENVCGIGVLKPYITITEVSEILEWDRQKTRRWLDSSGALIKRGGKYVTTPDLLKTRFPEIYHEIMDAAYDSSDDAF